MSRAPAGWFARSAAVVWPSTSAATARTRPTVSDMWSTTMPATSARPMTAWSRRVPIRAGSVRAVPVTAPTW